MHFPTIFMLYVITAERSTKPVVHTTTKQNIIFARDNVIQTTERILFHIMSKILIRALESPEKANKYITEIIVKITQKILLITSQEDMP